jgi:predicted metal-dependent phosphotriesterase family hydrolase
MMKIDENEVETLGIEGIDGGQDDPKSPDQVNLQSLNMDAVKAIEAEKELRVHLSEGYSTIVGVDCMSYGNLATLSNLSKEFGVVFVINCISLAFPKISKNHAKKASKRMETDMIRYICGIAKNQRNSLGGDGRRIGSITEGARAVLDKMVECAT